MSLYKELTPIIEYLTQIRKLENYLVFDVAFPITWKMLKRHIIEDKFVNNGTENNLLNLSFVSEYDEKNINLIQENILNIINYNLEREEKERLLESKINELKTIFDKESLDNLKNFKFDINKKIPLNDAKSKSTSEIIGLPNIIAEEG
jgi:ATP-dependent Lon protease